jgi:uncharacterized protein YbjT (DUF2867 family)
LFKKDIMKNHSEKILVLGATGKTGSRIVAKLANKNVAVRAGSRKSAIPFDWESQTNWANVLKGIETVYISFQPDLAVPGAPEAIRTFSEVARTAGVLKLVLLSGRGEPEAQQCEQIIMKSGLRWTIIRASWFSQNFSESYLLDPIISGDVFLPIGNVREPFVDADDIADVAVESLLDARTDGHVYEVTGPRLLTFEEAIKEIAGATGREIRFHSISMDEYVASLREFQTPEPVISLIRYLFTEVLDGRNEYLSDGVEQALGRKPNDFSEYVRATAAAGVWTGSKVTV